MNIPKVRKAVLTAALAAVAATAWATNESNETLTYSTYAPGIVVVEEPAPTATDTLTAFDSLEPAETVVTTTYVSDNVVQPAITIEEQRLSEDQRIQAAVMDKLLDGNFSGKIGVESNDAVVRLSGYTTTAGQAWRAAREARSVIGVRYVQNEIRPRVGGSV